MTDAAISTTAPMRATGRQMCGAPCDSGILPRTAWPICQQAMPATRAPATISAAPIWWGTVAVKNGLVNKAPKSVSSARPLA